MVRVTLLMACIALNLSACVSRSSSPDCSADGLNCKQLNLNLPPQNPAGPTIPNCAADGPGCKQFNPDKK